MNELANPREESVSCLLLLPFSSLCFLPFSFLSSLLKFWNTFFYGLLQKRASLILAQELSASHFPTDPFTIWLLQDRSSDVPELHKMSQSPDFLALILRKGPSGLEQLKCMRTYFKLKRTKISETTNFILSCCCFFFCEASLCHILDR